MESRSVTGVGQWTWTGNRKEGAVGQADAAFESSRDGANAFKRNKPEQIQKYSTVVNGNRYPIKQVLSAGTGMRKIDFTASDANRLLQKFGFRIDMEEDAD
jgi:hypothetical protein